MSIELFRKYAREKIVNPGKAEEEFLYRKCQKNRLEILNFGVVDTLLASEDTRKSNHFTITTKS